MKTNYIINRKTASLIIAVVISFFRVGFAQQKVTICHLPPGNPENAQTITISENALQTHLDHGDYRGECVYADGTDMDCITAGTYLSVYDSQGICMLNEGPVSFSGYSDMISHITASGKLHAGMYVLCVSCTEKNYYRKMVVQ